jgi:hypothetical protein
MESMIRIKWFEELDSTNNELLRHIRDYDNLSVIAAVSQTAGRGQRVTAGFPNPATTSLSRSFSSRKNSRPGK